MIVGFYCLIMPWMCYLIYLTHLFVSVIFQQRQDLQTRKQTVSINFDAPITEIKEVPEEANVDDEEDIKISEGEGDQKRSEKSLENSFEPTIQS